MIRQLLLLGSLLTATACHAGVPRMAWDDCAANGGTFFKSFACDTNAGSRRLVGTFTLDAPMADFVGVEVAIDVRSSAPALPAWWQFFNTGSCRGSAALNGTYDFSFLAQGPCVDPFQQPGQGGIAAYCVVGANCVDSPSTLSEALIKTAGAIANPVALEAGVEYYGFILTFRNTKTVGDGACSGCLDPVCLGLRYIKAAGLSGTLEMSMGAADPGARAGWQCGYANGRQARRSWDPVLELCQLDAGCAATPVRNPTWGQIKSMWR